MPTEPSEPNIDNLSVKPADVVFKEVILDDPTEVAHAPAPEPVPAAEERMQTAHTQENKNIKTVKGAEVRKPKADPKKPVVIDPIKTLYSKLMAKWTPVKEEMARENVHDYSSMVKDILTISLDEREGLLPRILVACHHMVYVVIDQIPVPGESKVTIEARVYAHIPAEVMKLVLPWIKELGVWISPNAMVRPSAL